MPRYDFRVRETGEIVEHIMSMKDKDAFVEAHPELEPVILTTAPLVDPFTIGVRRIDSGMREVLTRIKKNNPGSDIKV